MIKVSSCLSWIQYYLSYIIDDHKIQIQDTVKA